MSYPRDMILYKYKIIKKINWNCPFNKKPHKIIMKEKKTTTLSIEEERALLSLKGLRNAHSAQLRVICVCVLGGGGGGGLRSQHRVHQLKSALMISEQSQLHAHCKQTSNLVK